MAAEHEVTLFFVDGSERIVSTKELARNFLNRTGIRFALLAVGMAVVVAPPDLVTAMPIWTVILVNLIKLSVFAVAFMAAFSLASLWWPKRQRMPELFLVLVATGGLTLVEHLMGLTFDQLHDGNHWLEDMLRNAVFFQIFSILFFLFVYKPDFTADADGPGRDAGLAEGQASDTSNRSDMKSAEAPIPAASGMIHVGSRSFDASMIDRITIEDHLLRLWLGDRAEMVHGALSDVVAQLDPSLGSQLHRSSWVAFRHVDRIEVQDRRALAVLKCGKVLPIARNRRKAAETAFRSWRARS